MPRPSDGIEMRDTEFGERPSTVDGRNDTSAPTQERAGPGTAEAQPRGTGKYMVTVPDEWQAGQELEVNLNGQKTRVAVPDGLSVGESFVVDPTSPAPAGAAAR